MAKKRCRKCRNKFESTELNEEKLCRRCAPIKPKKGGLEDFSPEGRALRKFKKLEEKLARAYKILGLARRLAAIEKEKGKQLMNPPASEVATRHEEMMEILLDRDIEEAVKEGTKELSGAMNRKEKEESYGRMRVRLIRAGDMAEQFEIALSEERQKMIDEARIKEIIFQGNNAQFEGDIRKAIDFYRSGLEQLLKKGIAKDVKIEGIELLTQNIEALQKGM